MPSAIILVAFAFGFSWVGGSSEAGWLAGLKAAAVAVVAHAVLGMSRSLAPDMKRATIAAAAMIVVLLVPHPAVQVAAIIAGGFVGLAWLREPPDHDSQENVVIGVSRKAGTVALAGFFMLIILLPMMAAMTGNPHIHLADMFYRTGSLVFGGGHVVLPLLEAETVRTGLVDHDAFLAGYGAAQAVPGPLFTFSAFLGALSSSYWALGAIVALVAIFLPGALLVIGVLPLWGRLKQSRLARRGLMGVNAVVVGILAAALYDPAFIQGVTSPGTMALAVAVFIALTRWSLPAWAAVIGAGLIGFVLL